MESKKSNDVVSLRVGGALYRNWKEVSIQRSLYAISGSFDLSLTGIPQESQVTLPLQPGDECVVQLGDEPLITGYMDTVSKTLDPTQKSISISGRDKTGDLVDCSAVAVKTSWQDVSFQKIAQDLLSPFEIPLEICTETGAPFSVWSITPVESVFECLTRAAKLRGLFLTTNGKGALVVSRFPMDSAPLLLKEGVNLLSLSSHQDLKSRFQTYQIRSHLPLEMSYQSGSGFIIQGEAQDSEIKRNRTLCIQAEGKADKTVLKQRAQWEMEVRRAKSHQLTGIVQGFRSSQGHIWQIGDSVRFESEFLALHHSFLITSVHFQFGEQGKRTTLELESSQAIQLDPTLKNNQNPYLKLISGGL